MTSAEYEAIDAAIQANADYDDGAGNVTKARALKAACRKLLALRPARSQRFATGGPNLIDFNHVAIKAIYDDVTAWLADNDTAGSAGTDPVQLSFEELRS